MGASPRSRIQRPSQIQIGPVDTKGFPKGSSHPRTALCISCSLPPPSFCGHDALLCLPRAISAAKLSAAVCKQPPTLPAKRRQLASQAVHTSCPAWHQAVSWPPPGAGSIPRCHPLVSSSASFQPPLLQPLGTPRSGGNRGFQGSVTPQE